jgi:hypothetical protein
MSDRGEREMREVGGEARTAQYGPGWFTHPSHDAATILRLKGASHIARFIISYLRQIEELHEIAGQAKIVQNAI